MDAALITAIASLVAAPVTAAAAIYGQRGANRAAREGSAAVIYNDLTRHLTHERDKAETDEAAAEARASAAEARASAAEARSSVADAESSRLRAENDRLRALIAQLGGQPP
ncbi:hypothetical protein [Streptomyces cylindrosporus]|uniref:Uncharacterized protein n=1 Tax=Streptomyces cylindrosporus TaxID=2927583 RepID=A0ABS9YL81_9ACTN|nr:hypothetical protein [Streptomyces cylindrosporus]MCI3277664.1 hypothetical protein [Streptomyces cylindrosporus]